MLYLAWILMSTLIGAGIGVAINPQHALLGTGCGLAFGVITSMLVATRGRLIGDIAEGIGDIID